MIVLSHLSKKYPGNKDYTLSDISATLPDVGLVFLIGKSGSGKSTLLHLIGSMDLQYEGSLKVAGKELKDMNQEEIELYRFRMISFVFQSFKAEEDESVLDNLLQPLAIASLREDEKMIRIQKALKQVGLSNKLHQIFKHLSGGEKKRISLAKGLIQDAPILLLDEPLASLNQHLRMDITKILMEEAKKRLVFVITHETTEIPKEAIIYQIVDGKLNLVQEQEQSLGKPWVCSLQRKSYTGHPFIHQLWATLKSKKEFFLITLATFAMALFSISFSFQLSGGVSNSLKDSLSTYMSDNSLVISQKESGYTDTGFETADYQELHYLAKQYPDSILSESTFYLTSLNDVFKSHQDFTINFVNRSFISNELSLDSFLEFRMPAEIVDATIYGQSDNLEEEEVVLGLTKTSIINFYYLMFEQNIQYLNENNFIQISDTLKSTPAYLNLEISNPEWNYHLTHSFLIKGIAETDTCCIINDNPDFNTHFAKDILHFKEALQEETLDDSTPWLLRKCEGFRLFPDQVSTFLREFLQDATTSQYVPQVLHNPNYYDAKNEKTHNHVVIYHDYLPKVSIPSIQPYFHSLGKDITSIAYSSPVYTYTASGYISGFQKPFFFSKRKEKLNQIQDSAGTTQRDLGAFQASVIEVPDDVIKADLVSSMNHEALRFVSLDNSNPSLRYGKRPADDRQIGISSALAKKLYGTMTSALNSPLYTLTLDETVKRNDSYHNHFSEGSLLVSGIYENEQLAIYQDSLFPLTYTFSQGNLSPNETRINQVIVNVDLESHDSAYYLKELNAYPEYEGDFPMLEMTKEISKTMKQLSQLFLSFALLSLLSSVFLLSLSLYLIIQKDKKQIGILLSQGYTRKEISFFYFIFAEVLGTVSYIISLIISLLAEKVLKDTLQNMLSNYSVSVLPFLISLVLAITISGLIAMVFSKKLRNISPLDAFRDSV